MSTQPEMFFYWPNTTGPDKPVEGKRSPQDDDAPRFNYALQVPIIAFGATCAILHAFPAKPHEWRPVIDSVTLGFVGLMSVGLLLHTIQGGKFAGTEFTFKDKAFKKAVRVVNFALPKLAALMRTWTLSLAWLNREYQLVKSKDEAQDIALRFCQERMEDARPVLQPEDKTVRLSIWWYNEEKDALVFLLSNEIRDEKTKAFEFKPRQGLMGQAFSENALYTIENAPGSTFYVNITGLEPKYKGVLLIPIRFAGSAVGMLSIDREGEGEFSSEGEDVGCALAHVIGIALTHPALLRWFNLLPSHLSSELPPWPLG